MNVNETINIKCWFIWASSVLFYFYEFMIQVSPGVMAQDLMKDFNIHAVDLGNLSAYYFYSYASMQIIAGVLLDNWGARKLLSISAIACSVGCFFFSIADTLSYAELSRFFIGAGSACAAISTFKLAASWFPPPYFGFMTGLTVMVGMLGAVFGEAPLAFVLQFLGWRQTMLCFSLGSIIIAALIWSFVRDMPRNFSNVVHKDHKCSWKNILVVLKCRQTWLASLYASLMFAPTTALGGLWGVSWMCSYYSLDRSSAANIISFLFFGWAVGSPLSGVLTSYLGTCKSLMQLGTVLSLLCSCALIFINSWSIASLNLLWFLFGLASSGLVPFITIIRQQHSYQVVGTALGLGNAINMIGGALLQPVIGYFLDQNWDGQIINEVRIYTPDNFRESLNIVPILISFSYLILYVLKEESCSKTVAIRSSA